MVGSVAQTIQGEAGSNPAHQFAVAATIYNRWLAGGYGSSPSSIVNAPNQYTGYSASPNASAQQLAAAIENRTLPQYGNVGNAVNFQTAGSNTTLGQCSSCVNIGGNNFSDRFGSPTANFVPPQYGGSGQVGDPAIAPYPGSGLGTPIPDYSGAFNDVPGNLGGASPNYAPGVGSGYSTGLSPITDPNSVTGLPYTGIPDSGGFLQGGAGILTPSGPYGTGDITSLPGIGDLGTNIPGLITGGTGLTFPGLSGNAGIGSTGASNSADASWYNTLSKIIWDDLNKFGLILLALILIAAGAWALARERGYA
jgi:hypothetical protein